MRKILLVSFFLSSFLSAIAFDTNNSVTSKGCLTTFENFSCPDRTPSGAADKDIIERTIYDINFENPSTSCVYGSTGDWSEPFVFNSEPCGKYYNTAVLVDRNAHTISILGGHVISDLEKRVNQFAVIAKQKGLSPDTTAWKNLVDTTGLFKDLSNVYNTAYKYQAGPGGNAASQETPWKSVFDDILKGSTIDSHTEYKKTLAAVITAAFTADPDFFIDGFTNTLGELEVEHSLLGLETVVTDAGVGIGIWDAVYNFFASKDKIGDRKFAVHSQLDFMDKQVLGYFIRMIELLREVYNEIIFMFFVIGSGYTIGFYSYKKKMEKFGKEPFNINKMAFTATASLAFLFFSAPVVNDGTMDRPLGSTKTASTSASTTTQGKDTLAKISNYSTLAQETVRYTAQTSNYFANMASDAVMIAYLEMIAKKQGFLDVSRSDVYNLASELETIEGNKRRLLAKFNFYFDVCRKYYNKTDNDMFDETTNGQENAMLLGDDVNHALNRMIGAERLSYSACSKLEQQFVGDINNIAKGVVYLSSVIDTYNNLINANGEAKKRVASFVKLNAWGQANFGWIFSAVIPISYYFFDNAGIFLYDSVTHKDENANIESQRSKSEANKMKQTFDFTAMEKLGNSIDSVSGVFQTQMVSQGFMFVLPGFKDMYQFLYDQMNSVLIRDPKKPYGPKEAEEAASMGKKIMGMLSGVVKGTLFGVSKVLSIAGGKFFSLAIGVIAFLVAVALYTYMISSVTIIFVSALIVLKITLYYIELMVFFLIVPIKGIFFVVMNGGQSKNYFGLYMQSLMGLFVTPILIVLAAGVLIPASEFFKAFFSMLVGLIQAVLFDGTDMIKAAGKQEQGLTTSDVTVSIQKIMVITGLNSMVTIFSYFAMMIISFIIIINIKSWFMRMTGMEGGIDIMKESGGEMKQGTAGRVLNPVG